MVSCYGLACLVESRFLRDGDSNTDGDDSDSMQLKKSGISTDCKHWQLLVLQFIVIIWNKISLVFFRNTVLFVLTSYFELYCFAYVAGVQQSYPPVVLYGNCVCGSMLQETRNNGCHTSKGGKQKRFKKFALLFIYGSYIVLL